MSFSEKAVCLVDQCENPHHAHGYCSLHAARLRRTGSPTGVARETTLGSFWKRVKKMDSGCWEWQGYILKSGYGQIASRVRPTPSGTRLAHRVSYELVKGEIPDGLQLDHLCRNKICVNPDHLEPVTRHENVRRGLHGVLRTHCIYGHELTAENTLYDEKTNCRRCKKCSRESFKKYASANRVGIESYLAARRKPCKGCGGSKEAGCKHFCLKCKSKRES